MLKIPCYPMAHFLGIPDPYRVLGSDEVFVPGADILLHKQVIVYRYPVLKCSNFGLRTVVHSEKLAAMFQGATKLSKGIIFIGGLSRDIGGDFDGDKFVVIADPLIIENFTPVISTFIQNDLLFPPNYHRIDENDTIPLVQPIVSLEPELLESIHSHSDITSVAIEEDHRFIHSIESSNLSRKLIWEYLFTSESDRLGM